MKTPKMLGKNLLLLTLIGNFFFNPVHLSPIVFTTPASHDPPPTPAADFCILTPNFGHSGKIKFLEECNNLDIFPGLPMPGPPNLKYGIHPMVCCPKISKESLCFPTDTWCPTYVKPSTPAPFVEDSNANEDPVNADYELVTDPPITIGQVPKVSDEDCSAYANVPIFGNGTRCVNLKDCPAVFSEPFNPTSVGQTKNPNYAGYCGWDHVDKAIKVCCPGSLVQDKKLRVEFEPRFQGYQCHDKTDKCQKWKDNKGCRTDMHFVIDPDEPDNGRANSGTMFEFMTGACMKTCDFCGDKGCRNEHPDCPIWARQGFCITRPELLVHTCRESCGVCGFLSTDNTRVQVVGENTYSDLRNPNFDCGRFKQLSELNFTKEEEHLVSDSKPKKIKEDMHENIDDYDLRSQDNFVRSTMRRKRQDSMEEEEVDVFLSTNSHKFCGATVITDKWMVSASHCYDSLQSTKGQLRQVKINTIRDNTPFNEIIEIKRVFRHPKYGYPNLYNDIALLELGRRIEFDYDTYGDTPQCIDTVGDNEGKNATVQGFGLTETGSVGDLLEANVTVISNKQCKITLAYNTTNINKTNIRAKINYGLPKGLSNHMLCAQGTEKDPKVIRGACIGDSGGALFVRREDGRQMMVGIVSGGIGCGQGYPGWYTKVSHFVPWIECIIDNSIKFKNNMKKIEKECGKVADQAQEESHYDSIFSEDLPDGVNCDGVTCEDYNAYGDEVMG